MERQLRSIYRGPWKVTTTVHNNRRNLFSMGHQSQCHIATIISGSSTKLDSFETYVSMIEASPEMLEYLRQVAAVFDDYVFLANPRAQSVAEKIRELMNKLGAHDR